MLILPYTYRSLSAALDAVDIHTLAEAATTLGAGISRVIFGIIMPTIKTGIINGSFIAIALVLGEFTISNILNFKTFQVVIAQIGRSDGQCCSCGLCCLVAIRPRACFYSSQIRNVEAAVLDVDVA